MLTLSWLDATACCKNCDCCIGCWTICICCCCWGVKRTTWGCWGSGCGGCCGACLFTTLMISSCVWVWFTVLFVALLGSSLVRPKSISMMDRWLGVVVGIGVVGMEVVIIGSESCLLVSRVSCWPGLIVVGGLSVISSVVPSGRVTTSASSMMSRFGNESPVDLLAPSLLLILLPGLTSVLFFTEADYVKKNKKD